METKTKDQYLKDLERRSHNTAKGHKTVINQFEQFLDTHKTPNFKEKPLTAISEFIEYLELQGKSAVTINGYIIKLRRYLRVCYGVKIDMDDFKDFVTLPQIVAEELEPLSKDEFKLIIENTNKPRRRALYFFIASTGLRIAEALQIKVRDIDFDKSPAVVKVPAKITKGKKRARIQYLTSESTPLIRAICRDKPDDSLVFTYTDNLINALSNEQHSLANLLEQIGLNQKYEHNGHLKKSFHAMRAYVSSQIYNQTRDSEFSHAYLGHDTYLNQYLRKSDEERAAMFKEIEPALILFSQIVSNDGTDKIKELEKMLKIALNEIEILKSEKVNKLYRS